MCRFINSKLLLFLVLIVLGTIVYTQSLTDPTQPVSGNKTLLNTSKIEVQPFLTESGWGYTILIKGKPYIRQNSIPALEGKQGFSTREKARKADLLLAYKITQSIFPPTLSRHELDSLGLLD